LKPFDFSTAAICWNFESGLHRALMFQHDGAAKLQLARLLQQRWGTAAIASTLVAVEFSNE
jgi:hypothetical protein